MGTKRLPNIYIGTHILAENRTHWSFVEKISVKQESNPK